MRKIVGSALLVVAALGGTAAFACGDKLLAVGRGVRFQRVYAAREAHLVIYSTPARNGARLSGAKLQTMLRQAVRKLEFAKDGAQLDRALNSGRVDVVLVDFADLAEVARQLQSAPSKPVILPMLLNPSKSDFTAAKKQYKFVLKANADESEYLFAIDEVMKSRLKAAKA
jgi:ABC-type amino acid transport substrate-binding protein